MKTFLIFFLIFEKLPHLQSNISRQYLYSIFFYNIFYFFLQLPTFQYCLYNQVVYNGGLRILNK